MKHFLAALLMMSLSAIAQTDQGTVFSAEPKTDAEITNIMMTVNTEEMNLAKVARQNAESQKVKDFAQMMFTEHAKNNDKAEKIVKSLKETKASNTLKVGVEDKVEELKTMKGKEFDRNFMQVQVDMHKRVLERLDTALIPKAKNAELKTMLQETRGKVEGHLKEAQSIQSSLQ